MESLFLPVSGSDLKRRGIEALDIILIGGDAYVDHPSYGPAVIGRYLEARGFSVGIIAQPDWNSAENFKKLGKPRLFFGITSGNVDSMIANYTANKKIRRDDDYSPGGRAGLRPDRALIVYANRVRQAYKDVPIVLGGIEASLRRMAHYDYWDDKVRRSVLIDAKADILVYGMGEPQALEIARRLQKNSGVETRGGASILSGIRGTAVIKKDISDLKDAAILPPFEDVVADKNKFNQAFVAAYKNMSPRDGKPFAQAHGDRYVVVYPPQTPLSTPELDAIYDLPYTRRAHPSYQAQGGVPGLETVRWSLVSHRGCCGECSFCALYLHQSRIVQNRSAVSITREAQAIARDKDFGGTITDVGGPTANMYEAGCARWEENGFCAGKRCLTPRKCKNLKINYGGALSLYRRLRKIPGVKHVFLGSGLRYDLLVERDARAYLDEVCRHHIGGLLKVAPEHCSNEVLRLMGKPGFEVYEDFVKSFKAATDKAGKKSYIVNYFISAHPGSGLREALNLALYLAKRKVKPEQVQDFIPTPMTVSGAMYYTGKDPFTGKPVYVARADKERRLHRALLQYSKPQNKPLVLEALRKLNALHVADKLLGTRKTFLTPGVKNGPRRKPRFHIRH